MKAIHILAGIFALVSCTALSGADQPPLPRNADRIVVSADGRGDFTSVQAAVDFAEAHRKKPVVIFIRKGRYEERVRIGREKPQVHLVGEDRKATVITFTNNEKLNPGWIQRSVLGVEGDDFVLENLTIQNTTPYRGSQAEAVYVNAKRCVLRNADFLSFQDTLGLSGSVRVTDCYIEGDVDYVWGYGAAVFERCELRSMHDGYILQARNPASSAGYVFLDCKLTATPEVKKCWLARIETARFPASHVSFIRCAMGPHILPAGWQLTGPADDTLRFEEFASTDLDGHPLDTSKRDPASKQLAPQQAAAYTATGGSIAEAPSNAGENAGTIITRIKPPQFAARDFSITDFGAAAETDCTGAIAKAIAACHSAGGGRVVIPRGVWLTGAIHLQSNVNLHLTDGATLRFSADATRYLPVVLTRFEGIECMNYSPLIYAFEQENVAITGRGTLDGSANWETWWAWNNRETGTPTWQVADRQKLDQQGTDGVPVEQRVYGEGHFLRPNFIQPYRCQNVLIEGVTIINSPMWEIHPVLCTNVTVRGVTVRSLGTNNDGCDPESCRDVLIEDCVFETGDDCIAIKSGRNNDGRRIGVPCENVVIRHCQMKDGHGGVTMGSEVSGGVRNVFVADCEMDSPNLDRAFRFKSNAVRGGVIENIHIRDVRIGLVARAVLSVEFDYEEGANGPHQPVLRNVTIENVTSQASGSVAIVTSFPAAVIEGVRLKNCTFGGVENADLLKHSGSLTFENVTVEPARKRK
ncbi:MAG TPA: pectinesterase family protein [Chthoniobacteraceae bacterium]|jgi:unsaturated rhamnogalacturonyl hydrolase|nr:pectinesterase family protein [Chthoniobacteraceae bacterium]